MNNLDKYYPTAVSNIQKISPLYHSTNSDLLFEGISTSNLSPKGSQVVSGTPFGPAVLTSNLRYANQQPLNYFPANLGPFRVLEYMVVPYQGKPIELLNLDENPVTHEEIESYFRTKGIDLSLSGNRQGLAQKRSYQRIFRNKGSKSKEILEQPEPLSSILFDYGKSEAKIIQKYFMSLGYDGLYQTINGNPIYIIFEPEKYLQLNKILSQDFLYDALINALVSFSNSNNEIDSIYLNSLTNQFKLGDPNQLKVVLSHNLSNFTNTLPPDPSFLLSKITKMNIKP